MQPDLIKERIEKNLSGAKATVTSGDNIHYQATVTSPGFVGLSKLQQHRLVYNALKEELKVKIHALQLVTKTPEEI